MERRAVLGMLGAGVVSSGVLGGASGDADEALLAERFDCERASRPECEVETGLEAEREGNAETEGFEPVEAKAYPDSPATEREADAVDYAREHERAYARNALRCSRERPERIASHELSFETVETVGWYDAIHVVRLRYVQTTTGADAAGKPRATADSYGGAVYAVDGTGAARVTAPAEPSDPIPNEAEIPDPVGSGTLVDCF